MRAFDATILTGIALVLIFISAPRVLAQDPPTETPTETPTRTPFPANMFAVTAVFVVYPTDTPFVSPTPTATATATPDQAMLITVDGATHAGQFNLIGTLGDAGKALVISMYVALKLLNQVLRWRRR